MIRKQELEVFLCFCLSLSAVVSWMMINFICLLLLIFIQSNKVIVESVLYNCSILTMPFSDIPVWQDCDASS